LGYIVDKKRFTDWWFKTEYEGWAWNSAGGEVKSLSNIEFTSIEFTETSAKATYAVWVIGYVDLNSQPDRILISVSEDFGNQSVPREIELFTCTDLFTWRTPAAFEALERDYSPQNIELDSTYYEWDDVALADDFVAEILLRNFDPSVVGEALVAQYKADIKMPEGMPRRLIPFVKSCIATYKADQM
jgi:hypothetical protein